MINIKNLTKVYETINYNVVALSNLNFTFVRGEVVVILGRSGSGKTTFLNVLGGFDNTYSGSYFLENHEFKSMSETQIDAIRSKRIGFVFQHQVLFNNLTVVENVEIALNVLGVTNEKKKRINAMKALTLVGLRRHAYKKPWQLSGGEKQRVAIARALIKDPDIIICDEPTAALDSLTSKEILDLLANVCKDKLLIIATHNKSIVKNYGTRIIELKSGYVVRDELVKEDKSNIKVDELDQLVDQELYEEVEVVEKTEQEVLVEAEKNSQILRDLQLDLKNYTQRNEEVFYIDSKEMEKVVQKRREKFNTEEKFDSFDRVFETITNEKRYALTSLLQKKRSYLFLSFFLMSFILLMIVGFNSINEVFLKGDNTQTVNYQLFKNNQLVKLNELNSIDSFISREDFKTDEEYEKYLYDTFVNNNNLNVINQNAYNVIVNDPSFNYRLTNDTYHYLKDYLNTKNYKNSYNIYYDPSNVVVGDSNDAVLFDHLKTNYTVYPLSNTIRVSKIINKEVDYGLTYLYIENNELIGKYLIKDSKLPTRDDEIIISVETLMKLEIIGNVNSSDISDIYEQFKNLSDSKKVIEITQPRLVLEDNEIKEELLTNRFKIVGLYNTGESIESFYKVKDGLTFVFSKKASDKINILIPEESNIHLIPSYMTIDKKAYTKLQLDEVIKTYQSDYLNTEYKLINEELNPIYTDLNGAMVTLKNVMSASDLGSSAFSNFLNTKISTTSTITHRDLYMNYITVFVNNLNAEERNKLCSNCSNTTDYQYRLITKINAKDQTDSFYHDFMDGLTNIESLNYEQTINNLLFLRYATQFNHLYNQNLENGEITYETTFDLGSYKKLESDLNKFLKTVNLGGVRFKSTESIVDYIVNHFGNNFVNPNALMTSTTTTSSTILIIVLMYLLAFVIANLFGSMYQLFFINRKREFGSLRILGAKFDHIKAIIKLENKYLVRLSYVMIFAILLFFEFLALITKNSNLFTIYLYESASQTFTSFSFINFFKLNIITVINVLILMKLVFRKQLIDHNINTKLKDANTLKSITDWDGE